MHHIKRSIGRIAVSTMVAGAALLGAQAVQAQGSFPNHAIRFVVPFSPGGQTDTVSRILATHLGNVLGQQVVVENMAGAAGTVGSAEVARAKPDGYTLMMSTSSSHAISPTARANVPYDPLKDFDAVAVTGTGPISISVHPSVPAKTLQQLIKNIKANPGEYSYGTSGVASINHLACELFKARAGGLEIVHVPFKGSGPSVRALMGGEIPMTCSTLNAALQHHRQDRVRTLAVLKDERSPGAPDIPTVKESGVPGVEAYTYNVILAPAGTPRAVVDRLAEGIAKVMADKSVTDQFIKLGVDPITESTPEKAEAMMKSELEKWKPVIQSLGLARGK